MTSWIEAVIMGALESGDDRFDVVTAFADYDTHHVNIAMLRVMYAETMAARREREKWKRSGDERRADFGTALKKLVAFVTESDDCCEQEKPACVPEREFYELLLRVESGKPLDDGDRRLVSEALRCRLGLTGARDGR